MSSLDLDIDTGFTDAETGVTLIGAADTLRLDYHGGTSVLAPIDEIDRIWRYGAEEEVVTLDRLRGDGWPRRRAEVIPALGDADSQGVSKVARF